MTLPVDEYFYICGVIDACVKSESVRINCRTYLNKVNPLFSSPEEEPANAEVTEHQIDLSKTEASKGIGALAAKILPATDETSGPES